MPYVSYLPAVLYIGLFVLSIFYFLLPLLIYWRCGKILRRLERPERNRL
jgi:hypothetical protein